MRASIKMKLPEEIATYRELTSTLRPEMYDLDGLVSKEIAEQFCDLRIRLKLLHKEGCIEATCALVSIHILECVYSSITGKQNEFEKDAKEATDLMLYGARLGVVSLFDNLITCGIGEEADRAKKCFTNYQRNNTPNYNKEGVPIYDSHYMGEVMKIWIRS